jgi:peptidoglycan/LPS O-acetylase OafA/YrhL
MDNSLPAWVNNGRVPFLDGLRVLAIFMVIASHYGLGRGWYLVRVFNGHLGVTLFFVISGFLITLLLLREHQVAGRISLKSFYIRRVLRIFPAYYAYMFIGLGLWGAGLLYISAPYWISGFTYMMCYMPFLHEARYIEHSWSLAVEEHFYLLWPLIMSLFTLSRVWKWALAYVICMPFFRYGMWSLHQDWLDVDFCSLSQMSSIAVGCVMAFLVRGEALVKVRLWIEKYPMIFLAMGIMVLMISPAACRSGKYVIMALDPVNSVACCMVMSGLLYARSDFLVFVFNNQATFFLGALSYSLYLWQQPFAHENIMGEFPIGWRLTAMVCFALCSYYFVEKPFLRMKEKVVLFFR